MPAQISDELSATTLKWLGLAALQTLIAAVLYFATDAGSPWYFAEPALVVIGAIHVLRTGSQRVALLMLAYLVLALAVGLSQAFLAMAAAHFSLPTILDQLNPLHRVKEIAELVLLEGAWKAVAATRALRQVRDAAAAA
jgi:hypothetical protein